MGDSALCKGGQAIAKLESDFSDGTLEHSEHCNKNNDLRGTLVRTL